MTTGTTEYTERQARVIGEDGEIFDSIEEYTAWVNDVKAQLAQEGAFDGPVPSNGKSAPGGREAPEVQVPTAPEEDVEQIPEEETDDSGDQD